LPTPAQPFLRGASPPLPPLMTSAVDMSGRALPPFEPPANRVARRAGRGANPRSASAGRPPEFKAPAPPAFLEQVVDFCLFKSQHKTVFRIKQFKKQTVV
jgi:hypothetical protein